MLLLDRQSHDRQILPPESQNIRSVDEYYDPVSERSVELPAGYRNARVNGLGEYVIAEQEDYNPNIGWNQNWQRMERRGR